MSSFLYTLHTAFHVDQAILSEDARLVVIRFGIPTAPATMAMDELLFSQAERLRNYAAIYLCNTDEVPDFNTMYDLTDECLVMFFYRNKHMMCDYGTGDNNKMTFVPSDKQELVDIVDTIYRGAIRGKGIVTAPKDHSRG